MRILKYSLLGFVLFTVLLAGCKEVSKQSAVSTKDLSAKELKLKSSLVTLTDSLDQNWQKMSESDERKMASIRRLLDEISYTPSYNVIKQRQLLSAHARVKNLHYTRESMATSNNIDIYDAAQDSLINNTINLAVETPQAEKYPLITELSNDIQTEQNKTIIFRIRHDSFAREINKILQEYPKKIVKLGEPFSTLKRIPLFTLSGT